MRDSKKIQIPTSDLEHPMRFVSAAATCWRFPETCRRWPALAHSAIASCVLAGLTTLAAGAAPLRQAHAHNDYEHERPLLDALANGFCSVEADVHLVDGELLVAHDRSETKPGRTLQTLYLDPLRELARNNQGSIHPGGGEFTLLIDIKADAQGTYRVLKSVLEEYRDILTRFTDTRTVTGAVTVILSGARPVEQVQSEPERLCAIDGRLADLERNPSRHLVPLISDNWRTVFQWNGEGEMPSQERAKLRQWVARARAQGRRFRFWAAPDLPQVWAELLGARVDLINTDRLAELREFLLAQTSTSREP